MSTTIHLNAVSPACPVGSALDDVRRHLAHADQPCPLDWALLFVNSLLPDGHPAAPHVSLLNSRIMSLGHAIKSAKARADHPDTQAKDAALLATAAERHVDHHIREIRTAFAACPVEVEWIEDGTQLDALRARHNVSSCWHEPDELSTRVTPGTFDNAMGLSHLEQCVVFMQDTDGERSWRPVAAVSLATLCSLATANLTS